MMVVLLVTLARHHYLFSVSIDETVVGILIRLNTALYHILYYFLCLLPLTTLLFICYQKEHKCLQTHIGSMRVV
jgi:hypothetical protein